MLNNMYEYSSCFDVSFCACGFLLDSSGHIDWSEFLVGISTLVSGTPRQVLRLAFRMFDNNRNGTLSFTEIRLLLTHMGKGGRNVETNHAIIVEKISTALTKETLYV